MADNKELEALKQRVLKLVGSATSSPEPSDKGDERRIAALERAVSDLNGRVFDGHKWFVTVLFSAVGIMLAIFGVMSRLDVRDATSAMEKKVDAKTAEMEKRFLALAGEAFKKPALEILNESVPLDGRTLLVAPVTSEFSIDSLFLRNVGDKRTEPLSIRLSATLLLGKGYDEGSPDWERVPSFDTNYVVSFNSTRHVTIAPGETLNIQPLRVRPEAGLFPVTNILWKVVVFYGGEKPTEARFQTQVSLQ